ncbi:hypothetical protein C6V06_24430 [Burkholderia gladioli]|nr:hypothetical protein C6V06_24430 [Burkholderia gladioli]
MVTPVFATLISDVVVGLPKSIRRRLRIAPCATMRIAPDGPKKWLGFKSRFLNQVVRQAGVPFTSSNFSDRKTRWVDFHKAKWDRPVRRA